MKKILLPAFVLIVVLIVFNDSEPPTTIWDIAYDVNSRHGYTVYLKEGDFYESYLVLVGDYDKGVLLLREHVLDEEVCFRDTKSYGSNGSYYPASDIDTYLNTTFYNSLPFELRQLILDTTIDVTSLEGVYTAAKITEQIKRKVFLLSATELNKRSIVINPEGSIISYFKTTGNYTATNKDGKKRNYWLRSAYQEDDVHAWVVDYEGGRGPAAVSIILAVRPAFCIDKSTAIKESNSLIEGKTVYLLDMK